jgi:hypothetical protein
MSKLRVVFQLLLGDPLIELLGKKIVHAQASALQQVGDILDEGTRSLLPQMRIEK